MQIMFVFVDIKDDNLAKPFLTLFGLEDSEDTLVSIVYQHLKNFRWQNGRDGWIGHNG